MTGQLLSSGDKKFVRKMWTGNSIQWRSAGVTMRLAYNKKRQKNSYLALLQVPGDTADRELQSRKIKVTLVVAQLRMRAPQSLGLRTLSPV